MFFQMKGCGSECNLKTSSLIYLFIYLLAGSQTAAALISTNTKVDVV